MCVVRSELLGGLHHRVARVVRVWNLSNDEEHHLDDEEDEEDGLHEVARGARGLLERLPLAHLGVDARRDLGQATHVLVEVRDGIVVLNWYTQTGEAQR